MASWKSQCRSINASWTHQQATWHRNHGRLGVHDIVIYTDGYVTRDPSGWGFTLSGRTVHEYNGAHGVTTSSMTMEVEAVTRAIQWLTSQCDAQITHAIILTHSMNLLQKVESGMGCPDWYTAMHCLRLQRLLWICCPGVSGLNRQIDWQAHAGVSGMNRQIDWQAQQISHLVCSLAGQRCSEAWGTSWAWIGQNITALIAWRKEEKGSSRHSTLEVRNELYLTRQTLALFRRQPWGDCWEAWWSTYGPFWGLRCHLDTETALNSIEHQLHYYLLSILLLQDFEQRYTEWTILLTYWFTIFPQPASSQLPPLQVLMHHCFDSPSKGLVASLLQ